MSAPVRIYQLKIALPYIEPSIWRRLEVPGGMAFATLHSVIQTAMGWEDCHLWTFYVGKVEVGPPQPAGFDLPGMQRPMSAARTTLDELLREQRVKFRYIYDMGDDWLHEIKVEKVLTAQPDVQYTRCTGGERAGPPEDCGGFPGYLNLLEAMANSRHPEREELLEWLGGEWDAEAFDLDAINTALKPRPRRLRKPKAAAG